MLRRDFIGRLASVGLASGIPSWALPNSSPANAHIKLSCNAYSFNRPFESGQMTAEDMIDHCASLPFDAIDLTGYYLGGYPAPPSARRLFDLKLRAFQGGLDISGTGIRTDFTTPDSEERKAGLEQVKVWTEAAAQLDAPVLRVFTGRPAKDAGSRTRLFQQVADSLLRCADHGGKAGVMIVLQNHNELLHTAEETLELLEMASHPWLGLCLDIGSLRQADPYEEIARLAPRAITWQIKEQVYRQGKAEALDIERIIGIMRQHAYRGYAPLEILNSEDPKADLAIFAQDFARALENG